MVDPFADPDPFEIFPFQFEHPDNKGKSINVQIRGYKKDADEVWQSTGLTLWRASDYLCQYQMENMHLFQNKRTIELGAGLGLNGILAWRSTVSFPNSEVCITDGDSDALVHLRENVERNNQTTNDEDIGKVSCRQLIWGKDSSENFLERIANNQKYDVIIASDIIYAAVIVEPLWETIRALLKQPSDGDEEGGVFVMAYARRTNIPVTIEVVLKAAIENGFVYELVKEDDDDGIWVYTFHFGEGHGAK
jgi:predicted nicotinamide N-methyase